jgi:caa(3)-type oxidase subunit IV
MSHPAHTHSEKPEYHGHANYFKIWGALVTIFIISLGIGAMGNSKLAVAVIFALAIVKTLLVLGYFMHLKWEPKFIWWIFAFGAVCLFIFYYGVLPDIHNVYKMPMK